MDVGVIRVFRLGTRVNWSIRINGWREIPYSGINWFVWSLARSGFSSQAWKINGLASFKAGWKGLFGVGSARGDSFQEGLGSRRCCHGKSINAGLGTVFTLWQKCFMSSRPALARNARNMCMQTPALPTKQSSLSPIGIYSNTNTRRCPRRIGDASAGRSGDEHSGRRR